MPKTSVQRSYWKGLAGAALLVFMAVTISASGVLAQGNSDNSRNNILFTQQDTVQQFDVNTGIGYQVGTAIGKISGTTSVFFVFELQAPPPGVLPLKFINKVTITDLDGDQIYFDNDGSGLFHLFDDHFVGAGGPLSGTYIVTGGTGKYESWRVGTKYKYRAIATNPPPPATGLGTVYVEVYSNPLK
jgi:hypothetical protein